MYANFFGLRCLPFEDRADPQFTVLSGELEETLAALEYEAHYKRDMALVVGAAGVGKTQMIRALLLRLHATDHVVVVTRNSGPCADLIRETCKGFGISLASGEQETRLITRLRRHLTRNAKADHSSVLIVDNAENLTGEDVKQLESLNDLCDKTVKLLAVILVGQPGTLDTLEQPGLERIKQKLFGHRTITAVPPEGLTAYIRHRLQIAGAAVTDIFADDAIPLIHQVTGGVPRLINQVCHSALVAAYGRDERLVTHAIISEVTGSHTGSVAPSATVTATGDTGTRNIPAGPREVGASARAMPGYTEPGYASAAWSDGLENGTANVEDDRGAVTGYTHLAEAGYAGPGSDGYDAQDRLERSLAQAERLSATTDAKLAQFVAIEKHLATLVDSAERLIAGLTQTTAQANRSFAQTQQRMEAVLTHSEQHINEIDARITRASEVSHNLSGLVAEAGSECIRAENVNAQMGALADQLDDSMDEMETRTAPLIEAVQSTQAIQDRLDAVQQKSDHVVDRIEAAIEKHEGAFVQRVSDLQASVTRTAEEAVKKATEALDTATDSVKTVAAHTTQRSEATMTDLLANITHKTEATIDKTKAEIAAVLDSAERGIESAQARRQEIEKAAHTVIEQIDNASLQVGYLSETAKTIGTETDALIERVRCLPATVAPMIERTESTVAKIEQAHHDAEALRISATDRLVDLGRACEQTESLGRHVDACRSRMDHMLHHREWIETTVADLDHKVRVAEQCVSALGAQHDHLDDIKKTIATAQTTTSQLESTTATARQTAERAEAMQQKLAGALGSSRGQLDRMLDTLRTGSTVTDQLTSLNQMAGELHEALQGLVAHADEKIGRLDSHSAVAGRILRELSEANQLGQGLIEEATAQMKASQETAAHSIEKIETLTEDVWSLTTTTESTRSKLAEDLVDTKKVLGELRTLSDPTHAAAENLAVQITEAKQLSATLADHATVAREQLDGIDDVTPLLEAVRDADESARSTASEIQAIRDELSEALQHAQAQSATLESLNSSASTLIETQCQMAERMVDMSQTFDDKVVDTKTAIATGEELLGEFINQGDAINKKLTGLTARAENLESSVDHIIAKRDTVLKNAEAQTAHLEKLCVAVRKVFAGVSKATLEARDQTALLRQAEGSSSEQLAALTTRTQQAAATLQEWVEEAVRVQTRLERAVCAVPTIQQTHPRETLERLGHVVSAPTQTVRTLDKELVTPNGTQGGTNSSPLSTQNPTPTHKPIEKMIEEAQYAKANHR